MYKDALRSLEDVSIFPVIAITIFFVFFLIIAIRAIKLDKKHVNHLAALPLSDEEPQTNIKFPPISTSS